MRKPSPGERTDDSSISHVERGNVIRETDFSLKPDDFIEGTHSNTASKTGKRFHQAIRNVMRALFLRFSLETMRYFKNVTVAVVDVSTRH